MKNSQTKRLLDYVKFRPNEDIPAPELMRAMAGESYVLSFSKRISDARKVIQAEGGDFVLTLDRTINGQRRTEYRYMPIPDKDLPTLQEVQAFYRKYA